MEDFEQPPTIQQDSKSSVKIVKNAKGNFQYEIKVYDEDPELAFSKSIILQKQLEEQFNPPSEINIETKGGQN